jgi:hypothetical protein
MRDHGLAIVAVLILGASAHAAEKVSGENRDYRTLTEISSQVPGDQNYKVRQLTNSFRIQSASDPAFIGFATEVVQQEMRGNTITFKVWGMTQSQNSSDQWYWRVPSTTGQLDGQILTISNGHVDFDGGTGKFQHLKGAAQFSCEFGPGKKNGCDWQGQAEGVEK